MAAAERKGSEPGGEVGRAAGPDLQGLVVPADGQRGYWPSLKGEGKPLDSSESCHNW